MQMSKLGLRYLIKYLKYCRMIVDLCHGPGVCDSYLLIHFIRPLGT